MDLREARGDTRWDPLIIPNPQNHAIFPAVAMIDTRAGNYGRLAPKPK